MPKTPITFLVAALTACGPPETKITRLTPTLSVTPGDLAFGGVVPGASLDKNIQIVSTGRATLEVTSVELVSATEALAMNWEMVDAESGLPTDLLELSPSDILEIPIHFKPPEIADYTATLVIESNDDENPTFEIAVTGEGVVGPQPDIAVDATSVDFGTVESGDSRTEYLLVENVGEDDLNIFGTHQEGSGAFRPDTTLVGLKVPPGGAAPLPVTYTPDGGLTGHSGRLTILSDDPDEPEIAIDFIGGEADPDVNYPEAAISGEVEVNPPELVMLDGSGSLAGADATTADLTYSWSLVSAPAHSNAALVSENVDVNYLDIDVAGSYTVELVVTDDTGATSAPAQHTVRARPVEDLYIALTWDTDNSDVDLHVVPAGSTWFSADDLSFCHTELSWATGSSGTHSGDTDDGFGPETVNITDLVDTSYHIGVHYFSDNGGLTSEATVSIYMNGELNATSSMPLTHNYFWNAGYITIDGDEGAFVGSDSSPELSPIRECEEEPS